MKNFFYKPKKLPAIKLPAMTMLTLALLFVSCAERFPAEYVLELPKIPDGWAFLLGEPHWRLEWVNTAGQKQTADFPPASVMEIEIPVTWTNPVTAWPYWPERSLLPGIFKPAGALFPFDVNGNRLCLSWEAGYDSVFYWELVHIYSDNEARIPVNFDWPRFRELFKIGTLSEEVCEDPWLVNWRSLAERTVESNFDRRRIVAEAFEAVQIPVPDGTWYGTSPFAKPLSFTAEDPSVFPVRSGINVWVSDAGILRVNGNSWIFNEN